jgi:hypothetical protein
MTKTFTTLAFLSLAVAVAAVSIAPLAAQNADKPDSTDKVADDVIAFLKADDIHGMFGMLREKAFPPGLDLPQREAAALQQRAAISMQLGAPLAEVELISKQKVGKSFVRYVLLERFERSGMLWYVTFYRGADGWRFYSIASTGQIDAEFQNAPTN